MRLRRICHHPSRRCCARKRVACTYQRERAQRIWMQRARGRRVPNRAACNASDNHNLISLRRCCTGALANGDGCIAIVNWRRAVQTSIRTAMLPSPHSEVLQIAGARPNAPESIDHNTNIDMKSMRFTITRSFCVQFYRVRSSPITIIKTKTAQPERNTAPQACAYVLCAAHAHTH